MEPVEQPFEQVVAEHGPTVLRVCRALLTPADADDAWSETFLAALRAYPDLRPDSDLRAWLVTIAHRKAIDVLRRSGRSALPSDELADRPVHDARHEPDERLRRAVAALPTKQREAVVYRYLGDLSYADVAALLGGTRAAARRNAADGIAALRRVLPQEVEP